MNGGFIITERYNNDLLLTFNFGGGEASMLTLNDFFEYNSGPGFGAETTPDGILDDEAAVPILAAIFRGRVGLGAGLRLPHLSSSQARSDRRFGPPIRVACASPWCHATSRMRSADCRSTETSCDTPRSAMVTPNRRFMRAMVIGLWVITTKRVSVCFTISSSRSQ